MVRKVIRSGACVAVLAAGVFSLPAAGANAADKVSFAIPNTGLTFAYLYIAEGAGYWKDEGLDVESSVIAGTASSKALLAGDVQFSHGSGTNILLSASAGQPGIAVANIHDKLILELVLSKAAAAKTGLTVQGSTVAERAKALKGMTIAADGPDSILDGYIKHIAVEGGLNPETDITTTYLQPAAAVAALKAGRVDAISMLPPFTTDAVQQGFGVDWISSPRGDTPDLDPFVYTIIEARRDYCEKNADICRKFLAGIKKAVNLMEKDPTKGLDLVRPQYKGMDPKDIEIGYDQQRALLNPTLEMSDKAFEITQNFAVGGGMLTKAQALPKFDGVAYTNAYLQ